MGFLADIVADARRPDGEGPAAAPEAGPTAGSQWGDVAPAATVATGDPPERGADAFAGSSPVPTAPEPSGEAAAVAPVPESHWLRSRLPGPAIPPGFDAPPAPPAVEREASTSRVAAEAVGAAGAISAPAAAAAPPTAPGLAVAPIAGHGRPDPYIPVTPPGSEGAGAETAGPVAPATPVPSASAPAAAEAPPSTPGPAVSPPAAGPGQPGPDVPVTPPGGKATGVAAPAPPVPFAPTPPALAPLEVQAHRSPALEVAEAQASSPGPSVHIGRVDVVVMAPSAPEPPGRPSPGSGRLSRRYLRNL